MKILTSVQMMDRLTRICPGAKIVVRKGKGFAELILPKTALLLSGSIFKERFISTTFDEAVQVAWEKITDNNMVVLSDGGLPWESIMVLGWDSDADDWKNLPEPVMPLFKSATYKPI